MNSGYQLRSSTSASKKGDLKVYDPKKHPGQSIGPTMINGLYLDDVPKTAPLQHIKKWFTMKKRSKEDTHEKQCDSQYDSTSSYEQTGSESSIDEEAKALPYLPSHEGQVPLAQTNYANYLRRVQADYRNIERVSINTGSSARESTQQPIITENASQREKRREMSVPPELREVSNNNVEKKSYHNTPNMDNNSLEDSSSRDHATKSRSKSPYLLLNEYPKSSHLVTNSSSSESKIKPKNNDITAHSNSQKSFTCRESDIESGNCNAAAAKGSNLPEGYSDVGDASSIVDHNVTTESSHLVLSCSSSDYAVEPKIDDGSVQSKYLQGYYELTKRSNSQKRPTSREDIESGNLQETPVSNKSAIEPRNRPESYKLSQYITTSNYSRKSDLIVDANKSPPLSCELKNSTLEDEAKVNSNKKTVVKSIEDMEMPLTIGELPSRPSNTCSPSNLSSTQVKFVDFENDCQILEVNQCDQKEYETFIKPTLPNNNSLKNVDQCDGTKIGDGQNQSLSISSETQVETEDDPLGEFIAYKLRSLPEEKPKEALKKIYDIIFHLELDAYQKDSTLTFNQNRTPSLSTIDEYKKIYNDPFVAEGKYLADRLRNLPMKKYKPAIKKISNVFFQLEFNLHQDNPEKLTRQPIDRTSEETKATKPPPPTIIRTDEVKSQKVQEQPYPDVRGLRKLNGDHKDQNNIDGKAYDQNRKSMPEPEHVIDENEESGEEFIEAGARECLPPRKPDKQPEEKTSSMPLPETRKWQPTKPVKQLKEKPSPKPPSSYTLLYVSIAILCAVVSSLLAFTFYPKMVEMIPKAAPPPPQNDVAEIIAILKRDFGEQPPMTFNIVKAALRRVTEPDPKEPAIIMLLAEQGAEDVANRFARKLADSVSQYGSSFSISGHKYLDEDSDIAKKHIDNVLNKELREDRLSVVFVERLDNIPADAALIFHTYCDHENAPFKRVVYVMTVASEKTDLKSFEPKEWDVMLQEHLYKSWSTAGTDQISSLLSRLTVSVAAIVPTAPG